MGNSNHKKSPSAKTSFRTRITRPFRLQKKSSDLEIPYLPCKSISHLPTHVLFQVVAFLPIHDFHRFQLVSSSIHLKLLNCSSPYVLETFRLLAFYDEPVRDNNQPKWKEIMKTIIEIKKQLATFNKEGLPDIEQAIKAGLLRIKTPLPSLIHEIHKPEISTWFQSRVLHSLDHLYDDQIVQSNNKPLSTILKALKVVCQTIYMVLASTPNEYLLNCYVHYWKRYEAFCIGMSQLEAIYQEQKIIFELQALRIWDTTIFSKKNNLGSLLIQIFNSKLLETRQDTTFDDALPPFFMSLLDIQCKQDNILQFGQPNFWFSDQITFILEQVAINSDHLYSQDTFDIQKDQLKLEQVFGPWIYNFKFKHIYIQFSLNKLIPMIEQEIFFSYQDSEVELKEETNSPLTFLEMIQQQQQKKIDDKAKEEIEKIIYLKNDDQLEDSGFSINSISTENSLSSSNLHKRSQIKLPKSSTNQVFQYLKHKNSQYFQKFMKIIQDIVDLNQQMDMAQLKLRKKIMTKEGTHEFIDLRNKKNSGIGQSLAQVISSLSN